MIKEILLVFFCGLGIYTVVHDILQLIDKSLIYPNSTGYFSVLGFMVLYFGIKYLSKKNNSDKLIAKR
jgi:hypothetical protein